MVEVSTSESSRASTESMQPFVDPVQPDVIGLVVCLCVFVYPSLSLCARLRVRTSVDPSSFIPLCVFVCVYVSLYTPFRLSLSVCSCACT